MPDPERSSFQTVAPGPADDGPVPSAAAAAVAGLPSGGSVRPMVRIAAEKTLRRMTLVAAVTLGLSAAALAAAATLGLRAAAELREAASAKTLVGLAFVERLGQFDALIARLEAATPGPVAPDAGAAAPDPPADDAPDLATLLARAEARLADAIGPAVAAPVDAAANRLLAAIADVQLSLARQRTGTATGGAANPADAVLARLEAVAGRLEATLPQAAPAGELPTSAP